MREDEQCTVLTASPFECRWVTDRVTGDGFRILCGQPAPGSHDPWCVDHRPRIYLKKGKDDDLADADNAGRKRKLQNRHR